MAKAGNANALARLADQAFGRPNEQDEPPANSALAGLSREELSAALADIDSIPSSPGDAPVSAGVVEAPAAPTPALAEPHGGDFHREPLTEREAPEPSPHDDGPAPGSRP